MFKKGWKDVLDEKEKLDKIAQRAREKSAFRFFLKVGESANILFVDSEPFGVYEHSVMINGNWQRLICTKEFQECPVCASFPTSRPQFVSYFTILDLRPFETKKGEKRKYSKKLFGAKGIMPKLLYDLSLKHKGLRGCMFKVTRYGDKSSNTGDHIEFIKKINLDSAKQINKDDKIPFDYKKIFAPLTEEELEMYGIYPSTDSSNNIILDEPEIDIPEISEEEDTSKNDLNEEIKEEEAEYDDDIPF